MYKNKTPNKTFQFFVYFISISISLLLLSIFFMFDFSTNENEIVISKTLDQEEITLLALRNYLDNEFQNIYDDLFFLRDSLDLDEYELTTALWSEFSLNKKVYHQIRYIDKEGLEIIRVNNKENVVEVDPENEMQNKNGRYYFSESIILEEGEIYLSAIDLNIENGEIEMPKVPTLRVATPVFDEGELKGILILNCRLLGILEGINEFFFNTIGKVLITNKNGDFIHNQVNNELEFSFMYPDVVDNDFGSVYPLAWEKICECSYSDIQYVMTDEGIFSYGVLLDDSDESKSIVAHDQNYFLIIFIDKESLVGEVFYYTIMDIIRVSVSENAFFIILIFVFSLILSFVINRNQYIKMKMTYYARVDEMTNIYNRRYGLRLFEKINLNLIRLGKLSSICFIDIDSLKFINDNYGHEVGDSLIKKTVDVIRKSIDDNDVIVRLGGDEFLIIYDDRSAEEAEKHWQKILVELNSVKLLKDEDFVIWASHGVSEFGYDKGDIMDSVSLADKRMYEEKYARKLKNSEDIQKFEM